MTPGESLLIMHAAIFKDPFQAEYRNIEGHIYSIGFERYYILYPNGCKQANILEIGLGGEELQTVFAKDLEKRVKEAKLDLGDDDADQLTKLCISAFRDFTMLQSFGTKDFKFKFSAVEQVWSM